MPIALIALLLSLAPAAATDDLAQQGDCSCFITTGFNPFCGNNPVKSPDRSPGCSEGWYSPGTIVNVIATPLPGCRVDTWRIGAMFDSSVEVINQVIVQESCVPVVVVTYELDPIFEDGFECGGIGEWD